MGFMDRFRAKDKPITEEEYERRRRAHYEKVARDDDKLHPLPSRGDGPRYRRVDASEIECSGVNLDLEGRTYEVTRIFKPENGTVDLVLFRDLETFWKPGLTRDVLNRQVLDALNWAGWTI